MNVVALRGTLSAPPVVRSLASGDEIVTFQVTTRREEGPAESVPVSWLGASSSVRRLEAGAEVVVTGRVRRRFFRTAGATVSRTEVVADLVVPARQRARVARRLDALSAAVAAGGDSS